MFRTWKILAWVQPLKVSPAGNIKLENRFILLYFVRIQGAKNGYIDGFSGLEKKSWINDLKMCQFLETRLYSAIISNFDLNDLSFLNNIYFSEISIIFIWAIRSPKGQAMVRHFYAKFKMMVFKSWFLLSSRRLVRKFPI